MDRLHSSKLERDRLDLQYDRQRVRTIEPLELDLARETLAAYEANLDPDESTACIRLKDQIAVAEAEIEPLLQAQQHARKQNVSYDDTLYVRLSRMSMRALLDLLKEESQRTDDDKAAQIHVWELNRHIYYTLLSVLEHKFVPRDFTQCRLKWLLWYAQTLDAFIAFNMVEDNVDLYHSLGMDTSMPTVLAARERIRDAIHMLQQRDLALTSARHPRLGADSHLSRLDPYLFRDMLQLGD